MKRLLLVAALMLMPGAASAQVSTEIDGVRITTEVITDQLEQPLFLTAPNGDARLFVLEKTGKVRIIKDGAVQPQPFLDISGSISINSERGLLGLAFHPNYANNGRFFVYFTDTMGDIRVAAGQVSSDPDIADPASITPLLTIGHRTQGNHNGGWLGFGPDGLLYIGVGDGGGGGDPNGNGQNPEVLLGKILRIDVDGAAPYAIPPGNPFAQGGGAPEIFATGVRNPWRNAFDGDSLYIADVGQGQWEEVNVLSTADAGANLGWNRMEGEACFRPRDCDKAGIVLPKYVYGHDVGCSITGGYVYRGKAIPELAGRYFFGDYCSGALYSLRYASGVVSGVVDSGADLGSLGAIMSFGVDGAGELYVLSGEGVLEKIVRAP